MKPLVPRGAYYVLLDTTDNSGKLEFPKSVPKHSYLCIWPEETRYNQIGKKEPTQFFCDSKQQALKTPLACRVRLTNKIIDGQIVSYISMYGRYLQDAKSNRHLTIGQENSEHNRKLHFTKFANEQNKFELLPLLRRQHNDSEGISAVMRSEDGKYIRLATGGCLIADANNFTQAVHLIFKPRLVIHFHQVLPHKHCYAKCLYEYELLLLLLLDAKHNKSYKLKYKSNE